MKGLEKGARVLLAGRKENYLVTVGAGEFSTNRGIIDLNMLIGAMPGDTVCAHTGEKFHVRTPRATDFFELAQRSGTPMLPRDIGLVIACTGMNGRDTVLDAGTGSGVASIYFGGIAEKVVTYEIRPDFAEIARKNVSDAGLSNIEIISGDMLSEERGGSFDVVHLDLQITATHVSHAHRLLKGGGYLACYTPFIEQMCLVIDTAGERFAEVTTYETIQREMTRTNRGTRPSTRAGHSGYITICRK